MDASIRKKVGSLSCISLPPVLLNFDQTLYLTDNEKEYYLYYSQPNGGIQQQQVYGSSLDLGQSYISVNDIERLSGFIFDIDSESGFYPETCDEYAYTGNFYVSQVVQTWLDSSNIGHFYVVVDGGEKQYLDNSNRSFPHGGNSSSLKTQLATYYESVASFLRGYGIGATYNPNMYGSYGTGGIEIQMTAEQRNSIIFGSMSGYDLLFEGYTTESCIVFKAFDDIENTSSSLNIQPRSNGIPLKIEYTLLADYIPTNENEVNVLAFLGVNNNINIATCFDDEPS